MMMRKSIDLDDIQHAISQITENIDRFNNPEEFMDIDDRELRKKLLPDWKARVACDLEFQLSCLKLAIGIEKFRELPAFERTLRQVTQFIDKMQRESEQKSSKKA